MQAFLGPHVVAHRVAGFKPLQTLEPTFSKNLKNVGIFVPFKTMIWAEVPLTSTDDEYQLSGNTSTVTHDS